MSFSSDVKAEIAADIPAARHCRIASLAVLLRCLGRFERGQDGELSLFLNADNGDAVRKCFTLVCKTSNIRTVLWSPAGMEGRDQRGWIQAELSSEAVSDAGGAGIIEKELLQKELPQGPLSVLRICK